MTKIGSEYVEANVMRDVKALTDSGVFQEVNVDVSRSSDGVDVTFYVVRKMRLRMPVEVVGAKEFNHSKIVSLSKLVDGQLYSEGEFAEAALKVKKEYVSKYFSNAKVTAIPTMDASGDSCTVKFLVDEGKRMKVVGCVFAGISEEDSEALSSKLGMFPWWNPVGWFVSALVTDEDLNSSVAIITEYFRELGYLDVKVGFPKRVAREGDDGEADGPAGGLSGTAGPLLLTVPA
jgi:outer membrane protein insertion porin family